MFLIFLIPGALTYTFGKMVRDTRQGWALFAAMAVLFAGGRGGLLPLRAARQADAGQNAGIETRRDQRDKPAATWKARKRASASPNSALFATVTTDASCGAVNCHARQLHAPRRTGSAVQYR